MPRHAQGHKRLCVHMLHRYLYVYSQPVLGEGEDMASYESSNLCLQLLLLRTVGLKVQNIYMCYTSYQVVWAVVHAFSKKGSNLESTHLWTCFEACAVYSVQCWTIKSNKSTPRVAEETDGNDMSPRGRSLERHDVPLSGQTVRRRSLAGAREAFFQPTYWKTF